MSRRRLSCASAPKEVTTAAFFELVLECSGKLITSEALEPCFRRRVRKVVVAAHIKKEALNIVSLAVYSDPFASFAANVSMILEMT